MLILDVAPIDGAHVIPEIYWRWNGKDWRNPQSWAFGGVHCNGGKTYRHWVTTWFCSDTIPFCLPPALMFFTKKSQQVAFRCQQFGIEKGSKSGKWHVHGVLSFVSPVHKSTIVRACPAGTWIAPMLGSSLRASAYVAKGGQYVVYGERVRHKEACGSAPRKDLFKQMLNLIYKLVEEGMDYESICDEMRELDSVCFVRNRKLLLVELDEIMQKRYAKLRYDSVDDTQVRPFQRWILEYLQGPVDSRKCIWVWENVGDVGKTYTVDLALKKFGVKAVFVSAPMAYDNFATAFVPLCRIVNIVFIDCPRQCKTSSINDVFAIGECVKNGIMSVSKYESRVVYFPRKHFVVLANCSPYDMVGGGLLWSVDRLVEVKILSKEGDYVVTPDC